MDWAMFGNAMSLGITRWYVPRFIVICVLTLYSLSVPLNTTASLKVLIEELNASESALDDVD